MSVAEEGVGLICRLGAEKNWKNVNNWHWIEKDCTQWAHDRLKSLLLIPSIHIDQVSEVEGEVSVNVRKGKVRQIYDLSITLTLSQSSSVPGEKVKIIDFMSDTGKDDFELLFPSALSTEQRQCIKDAIWNQMVIFRENVVSEQGAPLLVQAGQESFPSDSAPDLPSSKDESCAIPCRKARSQQAESGGVICQLFLFRS